MLGIAAEMPPRPDRVMIWTGISDSSCKGNINISIVFIQYVSQDRDETGRQRPVEAG